MNLTYVPRSQLREALLSGHRLVPGHEYSPKEYAILMRMPEGKPKPASERVIAIVEARFTKQCDGYANNKVRGTRSYNEARRKVRLPA